MRPLVGPEIALVRSRERAPIEFAFERLLTGMRPLMDYEIVPLRGGVRAPLEAANVGFTAILRSALLEL